MQFSIKKFKFLLAQKSEVWWAKTKKCQQFQYEISWPHLTFRSGSLGDVTFVIPEQKEKKYNK